MNIFKFTILSVFIVISHVKSKPLLSDFACTKYSQLGEDGVIEKIFEIIGTRSKVCVEFGATDGLYVSNTAHLWKDKNWKAILIEANAQSYEELKKNISNYNNCLPIHETVGNKELDSIEHILKKYNVTEEVDLMSIDIDGNDYYIFESLEKLRPRVIVCEFNPTIPLHLDVYAKYGNYFGCSAGSLIRLAHQKGYKLISIVNCNCFFVKEEEYNKFNNFETSFLALRHAYEINQKNIRRDRCLVHLVTGYDGKYVLIQEPGSFDGQSFTYGLSDRSYDGILEGNITTLSIRLLK